MCPSMSWPRCTCCLILTCALMTTDKSWVRILIYNDCGTEKFLNVFFPVWLVVDCRVKGYWRLHHSLKVPTQSSTLYTFHTMVHVYALLLLLLFLINVDLAIFQPYLDLEAGDNQSLKIQVARRGIEPRSSCSASQELNHSATAAPYMYMHSTEIKVARNSNSCIPLRSS